MAKRHLYPVLGVGLVASLLSPVMPASADPDNRRKPPVQREFGNGAERNSFAASALRRDQGADHKRFPWTSTRGYPRQQKLPLLRPIA